MSKHGPSLLAAGLTAALVVLVTTGTCIAAPTDSFPSASTSQDASVSVELAHAQETASSHSQPHHGHDETRQDGSYNDEYVFGLTRGIAESSMHPAAKILVFPMTVPLDLALLPFEVIGGLF